MSRQNSLLERGAVFLQPQRINEKINNESIDFFIGNLLFYIIAWSKKMKNKTLRNDLIILGILVVLIGGLFLFKSKQQGAKIVIKRNDQIEGYYSLDDDQIINIDNENKIQIKNHEVFMIKATCPDHLCIKQGKINKKGATIVCLPHHLVVEVIEGNEGKEDGKVY